MVPLKVLDICNFRKYIYALIGSASFSVILGNDSDS